jgi:hypothetical protein
MGRGGGGSGGATPGFGGAAAGFDGEAASSEADFRLTEKGAQSVASLGEAAAVEAVCGAVVVGQMVERETLNPDIFGQGAPRLAKLSDRPAEVRRGGGTGVERCGESRRHAMRPGEAAQRIANEKQDPIAER